ncbi:phage tail tape measure protein [Nocardioides sp. PD653]|uniref:phage tail tape measure protein n=1 Tax=Nocardioides sp. PD653 TaxID=393303 RepID=UPI0009EF816C|nr:phage tail tape measure protein [Nocardioides sp. PD653]GAW54749.1 hypothetical protein PD653_2163 [Nocardioides sp. PD653]
MTGESRSVVVRLSLDTAQAIRSSKEFGAEFGRAMDQAERRTGSAGRAMDQLGGTAGKMALGAAAGLAAIVGTTANFDEAMSHVAATGEDARSSLDALREAAIQAGADTAFSASEAAAGIENLAKAGVSAKDILGGGLSGALDLAAAGGLEVADAAEVAATAMTQFKLSGQDVPHIADLLAAAAGKAQGDVSDMAFALKQSGLVASQMGVSIEETTGTLAAFASAGLLGSDAGTSFRTMLLRLANPTKESADLMAHLGIQAYDAQGNFVGMASVAGQLQAALQDKTQAERDSALATIFGSDAIRAASVLYEQGADGITRWTGNVDDAGYAAETAATRMDNLKGDLEQFKGSLETALIGAGEGSQGALRGLVQDATKLVNLFNELPGPIQGTVTQLLAIVAITGGAAWFGSKVVRGINDTRQALDDLGASSGKTSTAMKLLGAAGAALAVLAVAGAGITALQQAIDDALPGTNALTKQLLELKSGEIGSLSSEFDDLGGSIDRLTDKSNQESFSDFMSGITDPIVPWDAHAKGLRQATADIQALDEALANLVVQGSPDDAAAALEAVTTAQGLSADQTKALLGLLPNYQEALDGQANAATLSAEAAKEAAGATDDLKVAQQKAQAAAKDLRDELRKQREAARGTAEGFVTLGDSLNDSKTSLSGWLRDLEKQADALRDFRLNAIKAAHEGLDRGLIKSLQEAGPEGALRMKQLANATDAELRRANKAWRDGQAEIKRYVDFKVPPKKITVDDSQARRAITSIGDMLSRLDGKVARTYIDTIQRGYTEKLGNIAAQRASGGPIYGPGTKTSDSVPVMASRGEFMMSAAAVDHYGLDTMFAMNARRLASGGPTTGPQYAQVGAGGTPAFAAMSAAAMAADAASESLFDLAGLGKKELEIRSKLLNKEVERDQKAADAAKQHRDAVLDDMKSLKESIADRFKSDLFAQQQMNVSLNAPTTFDTAAQEQAWALAQQQLNTTGQQSPTDILKADIARQREARRLYRPLRRAGLHGAALSYAEQNASNDQLAALLADPQMLKEYQHLYGVRERGANQLGDVAAFQRYGAELNHANRYLRSMEAIAKRHEKQLNETNHRLRHLEQLAQSNPKETGDHVGDKVNGASSTGNRLRVVGSW